MPSSAGVGEPIEAKGGMPVLSLFLLARKSLLEGGLIVTEFPASVEVLDGLRLCGPLEASESRLWLWGPLLESSE